jgi:predicted metal-dependent hydrolase
LYMMAPLKPLEYIVVYELTYLLHPNHPTTSGAQVTTYPPTMASPKPGYASMACG